LSLALASLLAASLAAQQAAAPAPAPSSGVKFSGYLQARETYQDEVGLTGTINRARLTAGGGLATNFTWRIQGEFRTGSPAKGASVALADAYIRWKKQDFGIQAGQFKTPFTREYYTTLADVETADRATVVDSLAPKRDIGVMADYDFRGKAMLQAGVFNGEGQNVTANRDSTAMGVARLVVHPLKDIGLGGYVARYFGDSTRYGVEANYEGPKLTVRGEYVAQARDSLGGDTDHGWYGLAAYFVQKKVQLIAKYEDFSRDAISLQQQNQAWTGGANLFLAGTAVRLTLEYISREIGDPGVRKGTGLAQLQLRF
jgi:phosphate-selective porin